MTRETGSHIILAAFTAVLGGASIVAWICGMTDIAPYASLATGIALAIVLRARKRMREMRGDE